jgi:hypothetical protein
MSATTQPEAPPRRFRPYYEDLGKGSDALLRCHDCRQLVTAAQLQIKGICCYCGCRRVDEVRAMTLWEWFKVWSGMIDFPYRREFLAEFRHGS